ncbi:MAG: hypothetical protein IJ608_07235 [Lachnospiraceae bacterium]|nr:hypothetical protein [Lachnospiraceae bacterium]
MRRKRKDKDTVDKKELIEELSEEEPQPMEEEEKMVQTEAETEESAEKTPEEEPPVKETGNLEEVRDQKTPEELRRVARKRRRRQNQALAYTVLVGMILALVCIIAAGTILIVRTIRNRSVGSVNSDEQTKLIEEALNKEEEPISTPEIVELPEATMSPEEILDGIVDDVISGMSLEDKVAGLFIVTPEAITGAGTVTQAGESTEKALSQYPVGGIIYQEKNIKDSAKAAEMIEKTKGYSSYPLFVVYSEKKGEYDKINTEIGMNLQIIHVGDIEDQAVLEYIAQTKAGDLSGLYICVGDFPGSSESFEAFNDYVSAGADMLMLGNDKFSELSSDELPASLSQEIVTEKLRTALSYNGVVVSGSLSDSAIKDYYASDEAAIMALRAGCDMLLNPEKFDVAYKGVLAAVQDGTISEARIDDALKRIYRVKYAEAAWGIEENQAQEGNA